MFKDFRVVRSRLFASLISILLIVACIFIKKKEEFSTIKIDFINLFSSIFITDRVSTAIFWVIVIALFPLIKSNIPTFKIVLVALIANVAISCLIIVLREEFFISHLLTYKVAFPKNDYGPSYAIISAVAFILNRGKQRYALLLLAVSLPFSGFFDALGHACAYLFGVSAKLIHRS